MRWSQLSLLTALSAATMAQACAENLDDDTEAELAEIDQALTEDSGVVTPLDAGGGGSLFGGLGGGSTGFIGGLGGSTGGGLVGGGTGAGFDGGHDGATDPGQPTDAGPGQPIDAGGIFAGTAGGLVGGVFAGPGGILAGDGGVPGGVGGPVPFANWKLDDCGPSTTLMDSSPSHANAVRSAQVSCAEGIAAGAVLFDAKKDTLSAAANPAFNLSNRVALAAWINPKNVKQQTNLISKELNGTNAFELILNNGNLIFRINIDNGRKVKQFTSKAPISANRWTHVAALYDGSFVRLFEDGQQVGQIAASGMIADVAGGIQVGNNQANDFLHGRIDEIWLSSAVVTPADISTMSCIRGGLALNTTPRSSGPQAADTTFSYDVELINKDVGSCQPRNANVFTNFPAEGITVTAVPDFQNVLAGTTSHVALQVAGSADAEPGTYQISFSVLDFSDFSFVSDSVEYILQAPTGCFVRTGRELMIRDLSVVEDPLRTTFDGPAEDPRTGAWTFGHLMEQLAPSDAEAPDMVEHVLQSWLTDQTINTFFVPNKQQTIQNLVLDIWPRTPNGKLDLTRAPLRLLAIVNRIDSRNLAQGNAGEGRFVFGVLDQFGNPTEFTTIFEFRLPAQTPADVLAWANEWHALGALPFPSEQYNAALQTLTDRFSRRGAEPARPNGSALAQFRTNEFTLSNFSRWELREFELSGTTHLLEPATVKLTPDTGFIHNSALVADFINQNEAAVLAEQHVVPEVFEGQRFLGGSSFNDLDFWSAPGINNNEARHKFSLNTCNGCHSSSENGTGFLHINPRSLGETSFLSGFLTGTSVSDPVTGIPRNFNDLARRNADLKQLVCDAPAPAAPTARGAATASSSARAAFVAKGINRTH